MSDINYETILQLSAELNRPTATLLALAAANDPFNAGRPGRREQAEWFGTLWGRFEFGPGTHLRRVHYRLVSQAKQVSLPDGEPYENTAECWAMLTRASRDARYLGLVPIEDFVDRRNDEVIEYLAVTEQDAAVFTEPVPCVSETFPAGLLSGWLPDPPEYAFTAPAVDQRYHVELWCEKTTANDVLLELARRYELNVVTASGEISVTHYYGLVKRAKNIGRPVRILYVSDFDPAGLSNPVACARKIEFFLHRDGLDLDIQVRPIALTHEQCVKYRLPRTPIKESERRISAFEDRFGEGATELDALEALRPGRLRQILEKEICRYYDTGLDDRVEEVAHGFRRVLTDAHQEVVDRYADELTAIDRDYRSLREHVNPQLKAIAERFAAPFKDIAERYNALQEDIVAELEVSMPDPDEVDWPEPCDGVEDDDPLFDSTRGYVEQIDRFKEHQGKPTAGKRERATT
jgi:hypothetical protein